MIRAEHQQPLKDTLAGTGVKGRNNQVACEGGTDGNVGRLFITNLPDDEDLRVLAEQVTGGLGEIQPARFVDLRLHDAGDDLLGGVFDSDNVAAALLREVAEAGINGGRFAAARRAGQ